MNIFDKLNEKRNGDFKNFIDESLSIFHNCKDIQSIMKYIRFYKELLEDITNQNKYHPKDINTEKISIINTIILKELKYKLYTYLTENNKEKYEGLQNDDLCCICLEPSFQPIKCILLNKDKIAMECQVKQYCCLTCSHHYLKTQSKQNPIVKCIYNCCKGTLSFSENSLYLTSLFKNQNYEEWKRAYDEKTLNMRCNICKRVCCNFEEFIYHTDYICY